MKSLILKRIIAFAIDYILILIYGTVLYFITIQFGAKNLSPIEGQIVGFVSLTLPVFLYFYLTENSLQHATLGKRIQKIRVNTSNQQSSVLKRNFIKFLPWEIAHIGVHWISYFSNHSINPPLWVWIVLIVPQITVLYYMISILRSKGKGSLYDDFAKTEVVVK